MTLPALVSQVQRGWIVVEYADAVDEDAVMVRPMSWGSRSWQHEPEAVRDAPEVIEPKYGQQQAAILAYLREHGEAQATDIGRELWRQGGLATIRVRLCTMAQRGLVVRVEKGRYRAA